MFSRSRIVILGCVVFVNVTLLFFCQYVFFPSRTMILNKVHFVLDSSSEQETVIKLIYSSDGVTNSSFLSPAIKSGLPARTCLTNNNINVKMANVFHKKLKEYADFHRDQIELVRNGIIPASKVPTLTWSCPDSSSCSGTGDQFYRIEVALLLAMVSNRVFGIQWDSVSMNTMKYLKPHSIRWDLVHGNRGITLDQGPVEVEDLKGDNIEMRGGRSHESIKYTMTNLVNAVHSNHQVHLTITNQIYVPINKGINSICRLHGKTCELFQKIGLITSHKSLSFQTNTLQHILLQYLFTFQGQLFDTVNQIQGRVGLTDPYFGIHLRTGFAGNEYEETKRHFNPNKVIRDEGLWEKILKCSIKHANSLIGINSKLFLATDSYKVKEMAKQMYPDRIITLDIQLQHVAMAKTNRNPKLKKHFYQNHHGDLLNQLELNITDAKMGMWIDFMLLSRCHAIVYPFVSGFSNAASSFCLIPKSRVFNTQSCA